MSFQLDDIFFLENYETLLVIENHIYLSQKKYFSLDHFKNERYSDKNLVEIKIEEISKINFNSIGEQVEIETKLKSFRLIFSGNKMMLKFVSRIELFLILEKTEKDLNRTQKIIPSLFIAIIIIIICFLFGIVNNVILLIGLLLAIYQTYKMYGNSINVEYIKRK